MNRRRICQLGCASLTLLLAVAAAVWFVSPAQKLTRLVSSTMAAFDETIAGKDLKQIDLFLDQLLEADATVELKVIFAIIGQSENIAQEQTMNKEQFKQFFSNTLYALSEYSAASHLEDIRFNDKRTSAQLVTLTEGMADGISHWQGIAQPMHYTAKINCKSTAVFSGDDPVSMKLSRTGCTVSIRYSQRMGSN